MQFEFVLASAATPPYETWPLGAEATDHEKGKYDTWTPSRFSR